jgi:hypothetical protein
VRVHRIVGEMSMRSLMARTLARWCGAVLLFAVPTFYLPRWWCGRDGDRWLESDVDLVTAHARQVAATMERGVSEGEFTNSSALFRNEWQFGTYQMGALGLLQVCRAHPEHRSAFLPAAERAIDEMLSERVRAFDAHAWEEDPLTSLEGSKGHAAYLGYLNLALGVHRTIQSGHRFAELNDRITDALVRRIGESPQGILETYPRQSYPIDNAAVLGSILLHERQTGIEHRTAVARSLAGFRMNWRDPHSGLLYQAIDTNRGVPRDRARASGTALAAVFLGIGDQAVGRDLLAAIRGHCAGSLAGFGYVREYADGSIFETGDVDSGPVLLGISPSGTGFTLGAAHMFRDRELFLQLYRTAHLAGTPVTRGDRRMWVTGGPLGNAILLAMLTADTEAP